MAGWPDYLNKIGLTEDRGIKLAKWGVFGVIIALVPFLLLAMELYFQGKPLLLADLWPRGELFLVSSAISADAIGELIGSGRNRLLRKIVSGGACVILVFITAGCFAFAQSSPVGYPKERISSCSIVFFIATIVSSVGCKALSEDKS